MTRFVLGMLALSLTVTLAHRAPAAQGAPALAGFTLGSHRSDLGLENCEPSPTSVAPEGKQDLRCVANDSVAAYFADDELYLILFVKHTTLTPSEQWQEMEDWTGLTFGKPDTVDLSIAAVGVTVIWRASAERPWQLKIHLLALAPGTLSMMEFVDCTRARPGFCTN